MSDRMNDVLAAIDAETAKCICGRAIPTDGPSLDYCSLPCQYRYSASLVGTTPDYENQYQADDEITDGRGGTRIMWVPDIADPNAPTAAELNAGVTLGVLDENGRLQTETPALLTTEALNRSLLELFNTYPGNMEALGAECEPPLTAEEFRARALEHRQNRGTGPAERRQRLPRNHQR